VAGAAVTDGLDWDVWEMVAVDVGDALEVERVSAFIGTVKLKKHQTISKRRESQNYSACA
jgi:hypothetical protein